MWKQKQFPKCYILTQKCRWWIMEIQVADHLIWFSVIPQPLKTKCFSMLQICYACLLLYNFHLAFTAWLSLHLYHVIKHTYLHRQRCKPSGMRTVLSAKLFPYISKAHNTFILRVKCLELFDPKDEGTIILCNTENYLPTNTASPPRWLASSAVLLWKPQICSHCSHTYLMSCSLRP